MRIIKDIIGYICVIGMITAMFLFMGIIWLTDDAYGAEKVYDIQMTEAEYDELTRIVHLESHTEDLKGQMATVEVIFNRVEDEAFPNTVHGVLSQRKQFSTWKSRSKAKITQADIDAIEAVLAETDTVLPSKEFVYFCTPKAYKRIGRRYMHNTMQMGNHIFGTKNEPAANRLKI